MPSNLPDGMYHIIMYFGGDKKYLDLSQSIIAPNNPIIGFTPDDSKQNQKVSIFISVWSYRCSIELHEISVGTWSPRRRENWFHKEPFGRICVLCYNWKHWRELSPIFLACILVVDIFWQGSKVVVGNRQFYELVERDDEKYWWEMIIPPRVLDKIFWTEILIGLNIGTRILCGGSRPAPMVRQ